MTESLLIYDPTAPSRNEPQRRRQALDTLGGTVVGFIDNAKPNFNFLVDDIAEVLKHKHGIASVVKRRKRGPAMPATEEVFQELLQECDLVITGSGD